MTTVVPEIIVFIFGSCIGSFLNVCIYRLPTSKSIVYPGSMCTACGQAIRFYDNIPLVSYLWLRGKCRFCRAPFSIRYPLIELLGGFFAVCTYLKFGLSTTALIHYGFIAALMIITFIDIDHRIIPDVISLPGIPIGFAASFVMPTIDWIESLSGILVGGGTLYLVAWGYRLLTRKEGMGGGDIKLLAMIGAFIGWKGVFFTIFVSSAVGTLVGIIEMIRTRQNMKLAIPFGPFLAIGAVTYLFLGRQLIDWYLTLFR